MKKYNKITREELLDIVNNSYSISDVLRKLNRKPTTGNFKTLKKYAFLLKIDLNILLKNSKKISISSKISLDKILIINSTYNNTSNLKKRLYKEGLKKRQCELCGQNEIWCNKKMSLILDHINGISNDNRIENLRIVCPNCNATLPTTNRSKSGLNKYYKKMNKKNLKNHKASLKLLEKKKLVRKVERPSYKQLKEEIEKTSYCAVGRKYNVSDAAIRKWIKYYEKYGE